jgi:hypothetical protein
MADDKDAQIDSLIRQAEDLVGRLNDTVTSMKEILSAAAEEIEIQKRGVRGDRE